MNQSTLSRMSHFGEGKFEHILYTYSNYSADKGQFDKLHPSCRYFQDIIQDIIQGIRSNLFHIKYRNSLLGMMNIQLGIASNFLFIYFHRLLLHTTPHMNHFEGKSYSHT